LYRYSANTAITTTPLQRFEFSTGELSSSGKFVIRHATKSLAICTPDAVGAVDAVRAVITVNAASAVRAVGAIVAVNAVSAASAVDTASTVGAVDTIETVNAAGVVKCFALCIGICLADIARRLVSVGGNSRHITHD
jgi:hypothetical protein